MKNPLLRIFCALCFVVGVSGCVNRSALEAPGNEPITDSEITSTQFQEENRPHRILRVAILVDDTHEKSLLQYQFRDASERLSEQVGITLEVADITRVKFVNMSLAGILRIAQDYHTANEHIDMVFAVSKHIWFGADCTEIRCTAGYAGGDWRTFALAETWTEVIVHELGHALTRNPFHSEKGIMNGRRPWGTFTYEERKYILKYKWTNYRSNPSLCDSGTTLESGC